MTVSTEFEHFNIIRSSNIHYEGLSYALAHIGDDLRLLVLDEKENLSAIDWEGERIPRGKSILTVAALNHRNVSLLQQTLPWLNPKLLGLRTSAGLGDRLGLATPGHVRAIRHFNNKIAPIFAQQSIREMARTERTPQQVMDDALWGVFQENYQDGFGADADHLKTEEDVDICFHAGYTFFTIDPGLYVDNRAEGADLGTLRELAEQLPADLQTSATGLLSKKFRIEDIQLDFEEPILLKAMVKYGRAVAHVARLYAHLKEIAGSHPFEFEISVDETDQPTSFQEHAYIASDLQRLGVQWVSLAPRYVGRFEKGVDYIGDLDVFARDISGHAAIARHFGPYKLSLHSGSDKYSVYPLAMKATDGLVHLKTAGTSYLEALHTISRVDENLVREIYKFGREHYAEDRLTYHVSASLELAPDPREVRDWNVLLNQFDARQILHVTFGSAMTARDENGELRFYPRFVSLLQDNWEQYASDLEAHFIKHLTPFYAGQ
jgi:hypothetical protein